MICLSSNTFPQIFFKGRTVVTQLCKVQCLLFPFLKKVNIAMGVGNRSNVVIYILN